MEFSFDYKGNKGFRLLNIFERFQRGEYLSKSDLANEYSVSTKTIQRDFDDLRAYLLENHIFDGDISINYDKTMNKYYMISKEKNNLTSDEVLSICKILFDDSSLPKEKLSLIVNKMLSYLPKNDKNIIKNSIDSKLNNYSSNSLDPDITRKVWNITKYSQNNSLICISYLFPNNEKHTYMLVPVSVIYKYNTFFLIAFSKENNEFPIVFKIDEILTIKDIPQKILNSTNYSLNLAQIINHENDYSELKSIRFKFSGNIEMLMLKFPTANILNERGNIFTINILYCNDCTVDWLKRHGDTYNIL